MRCADLGPMPGSFPSSSMRSWTGPAYRLTRSGRLGTAEPREPAEQIADAAEVHAAHRRLRGLGHTGAQIVQRSEHEILEHGHVVGVDGVLLDRHRLELHRA